MKTLKTEAIVLSRTDFQEADRILNLLTKDDGKVALIAKGARRPKSKLAAGIELFCVCSISYLKGRGEIGTLISAKPESNFENIVLDISRVQRGYNLLKLLNNTVENHDEDDYFDVLKSALQALNELEIDDEFVESWLVAQVLKISGHTPNLLTSGSGQSLTPDVKYVFDFEAMCLVESNNGLFDENVIKCLRLIFSNNNPKTIYKISGFKDELPLLNDTIRKMRSFYLD